MYNEIIDQRDNCYGCAACVNICPNDCIKICQDALGFRMISMLNADACISCGQCSAVCPAKSNAVRQEYKLHRYYGQIKDRNILNQSSSGGAFSAIAGKWILEGGIVWGVVMNSDGDAYFMCSESIDELSALRGSKYVEISEPVPFKKIKQQLTEKKKVLFSGTPCQTKALKLFLRKPYDNFLLIDSLCYGVQAPNVWKQYLSEINSSGKKIVSVSMRAKQPRWKDYVMNIEYSDQTSYSCSRWKDPYLLTYTRGLYTRNNCAKCTAKSFPRESDITLGDFWQINTIRNLPDELDINRSVSIVLANTEVGKRVIDSVKNEFLLWDIPEDIFPNMKQRFSECHSKSEVADAFLDDIRVQPFGIIARKYAGS